MEVIYWQLAVAGSTAAAYLFGSRRYGIGAAVLWSLWTFAMLSYGPLVILQLFSGWGTFLAIDAFTKQKRELEQFKSALEGFRKEDQEALVAARAEGRFTLLNDANHYGYMLQEIDKAESSVLILSGWVSDKVIDDRFIKTLENALNRGVQVFLGFGFASSDGRHEVSRPASRALARLERVAQAHSEFHIGKFNNHQKALVIDKRRVVCGSHNWLSNRAFKNREQSIIIEDCSVAEAVFLHSVPLISDNPAFGI